MKSVKSILLSKRDGSINFFSKFSSFGKINSKPLIDSPIFSEYLSGNGQSRLP